MKLRRCAWANGHELLEKYHDREWGVPSRDRQRLFEMLNLEGQQAGLSWLTVLKKREAYREAFADFVPEKILKLSPARRRALMQNAGLIRHRGKLDAIVENAKALLELEKIEIFSDFVWSFADAPELSRALKKRGFRFVGPTTVYAFMQACGMVNDHEAGCFRRAELRPKSPARRPR